jgi:hypothetical protein
VPMVGRSNYVELAIIPAQSPEGLHNAVLRLRRGLRDDRDRIARHRRSWRDVGFAGMVGGDHMAFAITTHDGIDRREVVDVLRRRWREVVVKTLEQEQPVVAMLPDDAAALGRHWRGVEPLRVVIHQAQLRQRGRLATP